MKTRILSVVGEHHETSEDFYYIGFDGKRLKVAVGDWAGNIGAARTETRPKAEIWVTLIKNLAAA